MFLNSSFIETPLGKIIAIADQEGLFILAFTDQKTLDRKIEELKTKLGAEIVVQTNPIIDSITQELKKYFDLILVTGVWMHIPPVDRRSSAMRIQQLLRIIILHENMGCFPYFFQQTAEKVFVKKTNPNIHTDFKEFKQSNTTINMFPQHPNFTTPQPFLYTSPNVRGWGQKRPPFLNFKPDDVECQALVPFYDLESAVKNGISPFGRFKDSHN